jgi:glycerol uptake facilitator-like aquaporin
LNEIIGMARGKFTLQIVNDTGEHNLIGHAVQPNDTGTYVCVDLGGIGNRTYVHLNVISDAVAVTTSVITSPAADNVQEHSSRNIIIAVVCTAAIVVVIGIVTWKLTGCRRCDKKEVMSQPDELQVLNVTNVEQAPAQLLALNGAQVNNNDNELNSVTVSQIHVDPARVSHDNAGSLDRQTDPVPPARIGHPLSDGGRASGNAPICIGSEVFDSHNLTAGNSATAIPPARAAAGLPGALLRPDPIGETGVHSSLPHTDISMREDSLPNNHSLAADNCDAQLNLDDNAGLRTDSLAPPTRSLLAYCSTKSSSGPVSLGGNPVSQPSEDCTVRGGDTEMT